MAVLFPDLPEATVSEFITPEARELAALVRADEDRCKAFVAMVTRKTPLEANALSQVIATAREQERENRKTGLFTSLDVFGACVLLAKEAGA